MCILCATVRCSLSNAEHVLALAVHQLLGSSYNVTVVVNCAVLPTVNAAQCQCIQCTVHVYIAYMYIYMCVYSVL